MSSPTCANSMEFLIAYSSLPSIAFGRSSTLYPVSAQRLSREVLAGQPSLVHQCIGVHKRTLLKNFSLLPQFIKEIRFPYNQLPVYSSLHLS